MLLIPVSMSGQEKINTNSFNAGGNTLQGFCVGFDHSFGTYSLGIDAGTDFGVWFTAAKFFSVSLDNSFAIGKDDRYDFKTWHVNGRFAYCGIFDEGTNEPTVLYFIPSFGKKIDFNSRLGINLELGGGVRLFYNEKEPDHIVPDGFTVYDGYKSVIPDVRIEFFYRF